MFVLTESALRSRQLPVRWAACYGQGAAIRALECSGADVDAANKRGEGPLHSAASNGWIGGASELLESGAAIIIVKEYKHDLRELLLMSGAEAV